MAHDQFGLTVINISGTHGDLHLRGRGGKYSVSYFYSIELLMHLRIASYPQLKFQRIQLTRAKISHNAYRLQRCNKDASMVAEPGLYKDNAYRKNPRNVREIKRYIKDVFTALVGQNI
jgi:hypothetical protein